MSFTYNPSSTSVGKVRMLVPDGDPDHAVFSDEEITAFLAMEGGRVKRAAAACLETMASSEAYVSKAVRLLDLATNGPAVAASLMARAAELRRQDALDEMSDEGGNAGFEVSEWNLGPSSRESWIERHRIWWVD